MSNLGQGVLEYGIERGMQQGKFQNTVQVIFRTMKKNHLTYEQTCDFMDIPIEEYERYRKAVETYEVEKEGQP